MVRNKIYAVISAIALALSLSIGLGIGTASAQPELKQVNNGMKLIFSTNAELASTDLSPAEVEGVLNGDSFCTMGPVGTDKYGNSVGITAAHCAPESTDPMYVYHADTLADIDFGPIAVTTHRTPVSDEGLRDYRVVEFDTSRVVLSAQGPRLKIQNQVFGLLGAAFFNNNQLIKDGAKSRTSSGRITSNGSGLYQSLAGHVKGDSGGAAIWLQPGVTQLPSAANGYQSTGPWAGIVTRNIIGFPTAVYTSARNIQDDMTAKDAANGAVDFVGAGFVPTP